MDTAVQNVRLVLGNYEEDLVDQIVRCSYPINIAYDIGAHVGYMTLALAKVARRFGGKVFAFEPFPENAHRILELVRINNLADKIILMELALCDQVGAQNLLLGPSTYMNKLECARSGKCEDLYPRMNVSGSTIDHLVFAEGCPNPDLIKMDVEGAEVAVIWGALQTIQSYHPIFFIEIHGPENAGKLWKIFSDFDYSWWSISLKGEHLMSHLENCLSLFSKDSWTQHFLLTK
ncbi:MAG: FkbM family methyltransferase [Candidatus Helarchaeota archaeon]|nr:FkbM family methyltransferase [Candidatus Helarchaeota archaeon]